MTAGTSGFGTLLQRGNGGVPTPPETFATIAEVRNITAFNLTRETIDATSHSSVGGYREWLLSFKDAGEVSAELTFLPDDPSQDPATGLIKDYEDGDLRNFQIMFPDTAGTVVRFAAYVTGYQVNAPIDGMLTANLTLKISGGLTWNPVATLEAPMSAPPTPRRPERRAA